jgi:ribosome maturation factor RimP
MIDKNKVSDLLHEFLDERPSFFLVSLKISSSSQIEILIDSFEGISIKDCIQLSRHIEGSFDRDEVDFSLQVASAGLSEPFQVFKQYQKYVGRIVDLQLKGGTQLLGKMLSADEKKGITIETKHKEKVGKKKKEVIQEHAFTFDQIDKTKIVISFN